MYSLSLFTAAAVVFWILSATLIGRIEVWLKRNSHRFTGGDTSKFALALLVFAVLFYFAGNIVLIRAGRSVAAETTGEVLFLCSSAAMVIAVQMYVIGKLAGEFFNRRLPRRLGIVTRASLVGCLSAFVFGNWFGYLADEIYHDLSADVRIVSLQAAGESTESADGRFLMTKEFPDQRIQLGAPRGFTLPAAKTGDRVLVKTRNGKLVPVALNIYASAKTNK